MSIIFGILAGIGVPIQTSINARLRKKVGSPYRASLVSFAVSLIFLVLLLLILGQGVHIPFDKMLHEPVWIWFGGICSFIYVTGNILLFAKLGGTLAVILPVLGQILVGLVIDHFGFFYSLKTPISVFRIFGAVLVVAGVVIVSLAKREAGKNNPKENAHADIWLWRIFGVLSGALSGVQTAINGHLGKVVDSPIKASAISFTVGLSCLCVICIGLRLMQGKCAVVQTREHMNRKNPWWMWIGGVFGGIYVLANVELAEIFGTGLAVIIILIGLTTGGILVDHFGLFESPKKTMNVQKIVGICVMVFGATLIKLL